MDDLAVINEESIKSKIYSIRDSQVMLDRDLAQLYGVETKRLNEQVKRNIDRFPESFRFQLSESEKNELVAKCDRFNMLKHSTVYPYVFTEQGVAMLSAILKSKTAIQTSIYIIDTFVKMRKFISNNALIFQRLDSLEQKQFKSDEKVDAVLNAIESKELKPKQGIFYDGQVYDAYLFVSDLIKSAKKSIVLIDNYCDDTVLTLLSKRENKVYANIYTKSISKQLQLDLKKHNEQYPKIELKKFSSSHDRFLIIDDKDVYHIGASLKDLGKKWFAFSKLDIDAFDILNKL
ncbi:MAG: ORF6N domain-containing protein [Campylobacterota bacterium]|nr:ORF6N domain-containing protein [Campylobacterota bacterium]